MVEFFYLGATDGRFRVIRIFLLVRRMINSYDQADRTNKENCL